MAHKGHGLGKGDKPTISGDPQDMGLNHRERTSNTMKPRGETNEMEQRPTVKKGTMTSDRGSFPER